MNNIVKMLVVVAALVPFGSAAANAFGGSSWIDENKHTYRFAVGGRVFIAGDCNRFFGRYFIDGKSLKLGPLASTRKACPASVMKRERAFAAMLNSVRSVKIKKHRLKFYTRSEKLLATLRRTDWD